jgi:prophage antirepressor-like protein
MTKENAGSAVTLQFQDTELNVLDLHGQVWLRGPQIGDALGYQEGQKKVHDLYTRNAAEFSEDMTQVVELPTAGGRQQVRIFSLRGAHLLGMLARTAVAAAFRRWVLDVLDGLDVPQQMKPLSHNTRLAYMKECRLIARELGTLGSSSARSYAEQLYAQLRQLTRWVGLPVQPLAGLCPGLAQMTLGDGGNGGGSKP